jgi:hypothetical protein
MMKTTSRVLLCCATSCVSITLVWACGFDGTLREYLNAHFWLPLKKSGDDLAGRHVEESSAAYAGMAAAEDETPLSKLRLAYQEIAFPDTARYDATKLQAALSAARSVQSLTPTEREEVDLIDAKIDLRAGSDDNPEPFNSAIRKLQRFLRAARTPEYLSEARGWLAHIYYQLGQQSAAGKIYLDELNRTDSNLSRKTLVDSLRLTYGYDGGPELVAELEQYFDTPEHAAFAIQLITNPRWNPNTGPPSYETELEPIVTAAAPYGRITSLLEKNAHLFCSAKGASTLALLSMRTALRAGDPAAAIRIARNIPSRAAVRTDPDFNWMLGSAHFLSRDYAGAERPMLRMFRSSRSTPDQRAAAAYGLCGVYEMTRNVVEQIRMALWLYTQTRSKGLEAWSPPAGGGMVYWAVSGWDLGLLLDAQAGVQELQAFIAKYSGVADVKLVKYALAVRLARDNRYQESAELYESIESPRRAARIRQLASLYAEASRPGNGLSERNEAKYKMAEFLAANSERIYFNDRLWSGLQRYALIAAKDTRLNRRQRERLIQSERKLKDDQEERWRAYLLLRDIVSQSDDAGLKRRAAQLAVRCLRMINTDRFGREEQIQRAQIEISASLRRSL